MPPNKCLRSQGLVCHSSRRNIFFLSFEDTLVIPIFLRSCYTFFCNRENERLKKVHPCQKGDNVDLPKNNESNFDDEGNFCQQEKARSFNLCTSGVLTFEEKWKIASSAVFWRKVILVIFVIFELGPDSESLCNALPSKWISCGIRAFFTLKIASEALGLKNEEKS